MTGKLVGGLIVIASLMVGAAVYYFQVYGYYTEVQAQGTEDVQLTALASDKPESILYEKFQGVDAESSPIRYRACFETSMSQAMLSETYQAYEHAEPLQGPGWFDCFDAGQIGAALKSGKALAFLGERNVSYGIDRVVAIAEDGRGFVWHQINECGEVVFDGKPVPESCPPKPGN